MLTFVKVMDIPFLSTDMNTLVQMLDHRLDHKQKTFLVTANPEIMMATQRDDFYLKTVKSADLIIPDGVGIILGSHILGTPIPDRLPGYDLMIHLFKLSSEKGYKIYLLGAEEDVLQEAVDHAKRTFTGINIVGYHHGYIDVDDQTIVDDIRACDPDMVFVGLGCPKQEYWIGQHKDQFEKGLFIGVGGSFDVVAGRVKRAPVFWQKMKLEWLFRLIQRPSRWRRMTALPVFVLKILKSRFVKK